VSKECTHFSKGLSTGQNSADTSWLPSPSDFDSSYHCRTELKKAHSVSASGKSRFKHL